MPTKADLPRWLKPMNRVVIFLQRRGWAIGTMRLLSVPGRKSGAMRTTPVSPFDVDGQRYVCSVAHSIEWVRNARVAGWGVLAKGRSTERVRLVEVAPEDRGRILREFPVKVPSGVAFFRTTGAVADGTPEEFEAAAPHCPVFRVEPEQAADGF